MPWGHLKFSPTIFDRQKVMASAILSGPKGISLLILLLPLGEENFLTLFWPKFGPKHKADVSVPSGHKCLCVSLTSSNTPHYFAYFPFLCLLLLWPLKIALLCPSGGGCVFPSIAALPSGQYYGLEASAARVSLSFSTFFVVFFSARASGIYKNARTQSNGHTVAFLSTLRTLSHTPIYLCRTRICMMNDARTCTRL